MAIMPRPQAASGWVRFSDIPGSMWHWLGEDGKVSCSPQKNASRALEWRPDPRGRWEVCPACRRGHDAQTAPPPKPVKLKPPPAQEPEVLAAPEVIQMPPQPPTIEVPAQFAKRAQPETRRNKSGKRLDKKTKTNILADICADRGTHDEIAKRYGVNRSLVAHYRKRLGLAKPQTKLPVPRGKMKRPEPDDLRAVRRELVQLRAMLERICRDLDIKP